MIEAIFEGARSRCKSHSLAMLAPGELECDECKLRRRNMSLKPPFWVRCDRTHFEVKKDGWYQVFWIIKDGIKNGGDHITGYLFRDDKGHLCERVYSSIEFTPADFLTKEEKEKTNFPGEPEKTPKSDVDYEYGG